MKKTSSMITLARRHRNFLPGMDEDLQRYFVSLLREESVNPPAASPERWNGAVSKLGPHCVLPLLYWKISSLPEDLRPPAEIITQLRTAFLYSSAKQLRAETQLKELLKKFKDAHIRPLVLKGAALSRLVYPRPGLRPFSDIDLLVPAEEMEKAGEILTSSGYRCLCDRFEVYQDFKRDEVYTPPAKNGITVELHWNLHSYYIRGRRMSTAGLFEKSVKVELNDMVLETLNPVDSLIHAAVHLCFLHPESIRLIWLYDTALLARTLKTDKDQAELMERSREQGAYIAVLESLKLAGIWTGLGPPAGMPLFSHWPEPEEHEKKFFRTIMNKKKPGALFRASWPGSLTAAKKIKFLFFVIFPPVGILRRKYPSMKNAFLPVYYFRRWMEWLKRV